MKQTGKDPSDLKTMIADYMENGFLDNIIDMFKHDMSLCSCTGNLITDERTRVRIGTVALFETLKSEVPKKVSEALPYILPVLKNRNPVYRGDAAYLLGIIGDPAAIPFLEEATKDGDAHVRTIAREAIEQIESGD
ncbi:MAG: HEAT repeat domain-containing protein [Nitrospirota bacterium]